MTTTARERPEWLSRTRLVDEVAEELRARIASGHYPTGEPLRQVQISEELNVSRTPLREAFRVLEREGFLKPDVSGGVSVTVASEGRLIAAYRLREVLDGLAARLAAERRDPASIAHLQDWVSRQRHAFEPWDPVAYTSANVGFHAAILDLTDNEFLIAQLAIVRMTAQVLTPTVRISRDRVQRAIVEHDDIIVAIEAGDGDRAEAVARSHIRSTISALGGLQGGASQVEPIGQRMWKGAGGM